VAVATCWLAFGPLVTAARAAGALVASGALRHVLASLTAPAHGAANRPRFDVASAQTERLEPFGELAAIGASSAAALPVATVAAHASGPLRIALGLALGVLAPCATAGVALAAGAAHRAPELAAGILITSGIAPRSLWSKHLQKPLAILARYADRGYAGAAACAGNGVDGRFATGLLLIALMALCCRGPAGLVNPRLVALAGAGAVGAALYASRRPRAPAGAWLIPAVMLLALAAGSPVPSYAANETTAAEGFAGERVDFSGVLFETSGNRPPRLIRFAITCCRLDAEAVELPLDRALSVRAGSWVAAHGRLAERNGSLILKVETWHAIRPPADPFVYR
jgi:hypothetical protein